jgi:hypothetical protein
MPPELQTPRLVARVHGRIREPQRRRPWRAVAVALAVLVSVAATVRDRSVAEYVRAQFVAPNPAWIDALHLHDVAVVQTQNGPRGPMFEQLFWNTSITRELLLGQAEATDLFSAPRVVIAGNGTLRTNAGVVRSPLLFQAYGVTARLAGAVLAARWSTFDLWRPTSVPRMCMLEAGRYWDGWLAWGGKITAWPDASGRTRGTLAFTLSLPRSAARAVEVRVGAQRVRVVPGARVPLRFRLDGTGPQTLTFNTSGGTVSTDLRPVSVRSTVPVFTHV